MLSTKVIYAIEILTELANAKPNRNGKRVVKRSGIEQRCGMDPIVSSTVLNSLYKYEYIDRSSTGYMPVKGLRDISLYEIIDLFHNGIVIGELVYLMYCRGNYTRDSVYKKLVTFEKELSTDLTARFKNIKIADLVEERPSGEA